MILFVVIFDLGGSPFQKPISGGTLASMISCLAVLFSSAPEEAHLCFTSGVPSQRSQTISAMKLSSPQAILSAVLIPTSSHYTTD